MRNRTVLYATAGGQGEICTSCTVELARSIWLSARKPPSSRVGKLPISHSQSSVMVAYTKHISRPHWETPSARPIVLTTSASPRLTVWIHKSRSSGKHFDFRILRRDVGCPCRKQNATALSTSNTCTPKLPPAHAWGGRAVFPREFGERSPPTGPHGGGVQGDRASIV